jgi:hypothetical protein
MLSLSPERDKSRGWRTAGSTVSIWIGIIVIALGSSPALAVFDTYMVPGWSYRVFYDDNFRMHSTGDAAKLSEITLQTSWHLVHPRHHTWLDMRWMSLNYETSGNFDTDNQFATLNYQFSGPTWKAGTNAGFSRDSAMTDELDPSGLVVSHDVRRESLNLGASLSWQLSPLDVVTGALSLGDLHYIDAESTGLSDNELQSGSLTWKRDITETISGQVMANASSVDFLLTEQQADSTDLGVGINWRASDTLQVGASGGLRNTIQKRRISFFFLSFEDKQTSTSNYFGASVDKQFERANIGLSLDNRLTPGSDGSLLTTRSLAARFSWQQDQRQSWGLVGQLNDSEDTIAQDENQRREYGSLLGEYRYMINADLKMTFSLRYRWQIEDSNNDVRESYAGWVRLDWTGQRWGL